MRLFNTGATVLSALLCLLPLAGAAFLWGKLPDPIAVAYDADLNPISWMAKPIAVLGLPMAMCAWSLIIARLGYWRADRGESCTLLYIAMWISPMISIAYSVYFIVGAVADAPALDAFGFLAMAIVVFASGYTLMQMRANTRFGIRTPWSLATRENWERTNRVGGLCFMFAGIAIACIGIAVMLKEVSAQTVTIAVVAIALLAVLIPTVCSYVTRSGA